MAELEQRVRAVFAAQFGGAPDLVARAPGRVNLIGEHTDYNDGFVLPMAIGCGTMVAARRRGDGVVQVHAGDFGATDSFRTGGDLRPSADQTWSNYVRGVAAALQAQGLALGGADLAIVGDVPQGAGLSSSASLEVAVGLAFAALEGAPDYDRTKLALAGQYAEHAFAGCRCGIMDQLVSARAEAGSAMLIDCRSLDVQAVSMPAELALMIVHSGVSRELGDGAYDERRRQCEAASAHYRAAALRDVDIAGLEAGRARLDEVAYCRARHVVTENARVLSAVAALKAGDLPELSQLMAESHASMRDDFAITVPAVDQLAEILQDAVGTRGGARMTGGGFGGAVVAIMAASRVNEVCECVLGAYRTPAGDPPLIMVERPAAGASLLG